MIQIVSSCSWFSGRGKCRNRNGKRDVLSVMMEINTEKGPSSEKRVRVGKEFNQERLPRGGDAYTESPRRGKNHLGQG